MGEGHLPVLVDEVISSLGIGPGSSVADCTVGGGGHAERILEATSPHGRLLGLDADRAAIAEATSVLAPYGDRVILRHANFESIYDAAVDSGLAPLDAVLFDLGLSSYQLADPSRGFSFAADAPPDMRFDETTGLSALELIDRSSERELAGILATFGEERRAGRIAKAILAARSEGRLVTAADLADVVAAAAPPRRGGADAGRIHPATRTFQALRIAVNREVEVLSAGLAGALAAMHPGGHLAVIATTASRTGSSSASSRERAATASRIRCRRSAPAATAPSCAPSPRASSPRAPRRSGGTAARAARSCASPRSSRSARERAGGSPE